MHTCRRTRRYGGIGADGNIDSRRRLCHLRRRPPQAPWRPWAPTDREPRGAVARVRDTIPHAVRVSIAVFMLLAPFSPVTEVSEKLIMLARGNAAPSHGRSGPGPPSGADGPLALESAVESPCRPDAMSGTGRPACL